MQLSYTDQAQFFNDFKALTDKNSRRIRILKCSNSRPFSATTKTSCFYNRCLLWPTSQASQAFWEIEDIEKEVADLMARGVKFEKYELPSQPQPVRELHGLKKVTSWR